MYETNDYSEIVGCSCTLLFPYKGYTEGIVLSDFGTEIIVQLSSGKELVRNRYDVIIND